MFYSLYCFKTHKVSELQFFNKVFVLRYTSDYISEVSPDDKYFSLRETACEGLIKSSGGFVLRDLERLHKILIANPPTVVGAKRRDRPSSSRG